MQIHILEKVFFLSSVILESYFGGYNKISHITLTRAYNPSNRIFLPGTLKMFRDNRKNNEEIKRENIFRYCSFKYFMIYISSPLPSVSSLFSQTIFLCLYPSVSFPLFRATPFHRSSFFPCLHPLFSSYSLDNGLFKFRPRKFPEISSLCEGYQHVLAGS